MPGASTAVALLKGAPPVIKFLMDMLDKVGVAEMIKRSFTEAMSVSQSVTITLKIESSQDFKNFCRYPHHGQQVGNVCPFIHGKNNATMKFAKEKIAFWSKWLY